MSEMFEEDEDVIEVSDDFIDVDSDLDVEAEVEVGSGDLDARRRLENMFDEKRLRDELDDFVDY